MGGRIAMSYTAKYPDDVLALVVEDMDTRRRSVDSNFIKNFDEERAIAFARSHDKMSSVKNELEKIGYPPDMYSKWIQEGRIYEEKDKVWSDVNPAFRALCYLTIFDSDSGTDSWKAIATNIRQHIDNGKGEERTKVHLMVAGIGTVCDDASLQEMREDIPSVEEKVYEQGTHSIHNSARDEFMSDLAQIINNARVAMAQL